MKKLLNCQYVFLQTSIIPWHQIRVNSNSWQRTFGRFLMGASCTVYSTLLLNPQLHLPYKYDTIYKEIHRLSNGDGIATKTYFLCFCVCVCVSMCVCGCACYFKGVFPPTSSVSYWIFDSVSWGRPSWVYLDFTANLICEFYCSNICSSAPFFHINKSYLCVLFLYSSSGKKLLQVWNAIIITVALACFNIVR